jgi:hypothetical protein
MKINAILALFVVFATRLPAADATVSETSPMADGSIIRFSAPEGRVGGKRMLSRVDGDGHRTLVWETDFNERTTIFGGDVPGVDPYFGSQVVAAAQKGNVLLVLFRLKPKDLKLTGAIPDMSDKYSQYMKEWDGHNSFLRCFVRNTDNTWSVHLSCFIDTLWGDVVGERVSALEVVDKNTYKVIYLKKWKLGGDLKNRYADKYKIYETQEGTTTRMIRYDEKLKLLFSLEQDGSPVYLHGSSWWASFDEFEFEKGSPKDYGFVTTAHDKNSQEPGVVVKEYMFIRKAEGNKPPKSAQSLLNNR